MHRVKLRYLAPVAVAVVVIAGLFVPRGQSGGTGALPAPQVDHPAPAFELPQLGGSPLRLSALRHRVVLINFWATWCGPCRSEMPRLAGWYRRLQTHGFAVVGIDNQEPLSDVQGYIRQLHVGYPVVIDSTGATFAKYNVIPIPQSFLVDKLGIIRSVSYGALDDRFFVKHVVPLVK